MKTIVLFAGLICAFCLFTAASAKPAADGAALEAIDVNPLMEQLAAGNSEPVVHLNRQKRFTCDVLKSPPACSAHCVALGKWRGGYCSRQGICICRQ
ncbi:defensin-B-like [Anastrepha ludens]|uniref:defensin-B-like n=1 Tax=Anastrepha ludens TaxID=28586 RepID=UPI0023AE8B2E|nr:defensin-B-like [Anastrepha ludens]